MAKIPPQPLQRAEDLAVPAGGGPPHGRGTAGRNDRLERLAWLPIAVLFGAMVVLWVAGPRTEYPSPALMMALNFLTRTVASLVVVALAGRSFLIRRTPGLLLLGSGVAIWGAAGLVTTAVVAREANLGITISNLGLWLSAICHLAGAVLSVRSARTVGPADLWLAAGVTLALGAVGLVTLATFEGWLPVFFVQGEGGTVVRHLVLTSAIGMFVLAALLLHVNHPASSSFARWYAFALLLIAAGVFGMLVQSVRNSALDWVCRAAQYLGGVYMLVAAFAAMRESGGRWITLEQVRGQARYRYGMAAAVVIAAGATRLAFPVLGERYPFVTFYPAVMCAALYGGLPAGMLAALLSGGLVVYFHFEPIGERASHTPSDWLVMVLFLGTCAVISWMVDAMQRAEARAGEAETQVRIDAARRQDLETLAEAHRKHADLVESIQDGFFSLDRHWRLTYINQRAANNAGMEPEALVGHCIWEKFPQLVGTPLETHYRRVMEERTPAAFELQGVVRDKWYDVSVYPSVEGISVYWRDATDRKKAEDALRESEERFRLAICQAGMVVFAQDRDLRYTWAFNPNPAYAEEAIYLGKTDAEVHSDEIAAPLTALKQRVLETGVGGREEVWLDIAGMRFAYDLMVQPRRDAAGDIVGIVGYATDITERKRAEERTRALQEITEALSAALTPEQVGDVVLNQGMRVAGAAVATLAILVDGAVEVRASLGLSGDTWPAWRRFPLDTRVVTSDAVRTGRAIMVSSLAEYEAAYPDGAAVMRAHGLGAVAALPMIVGDRVLGAVLFSYHGAHQFGREEVAFLDAVVGQTAQAVERAGLYEQAERIAAELRVADRRKDEFLAMLGHELRNPLAAITGAVQLMQMPGATEPMLARARDAAARQGAHMARLLDDLLDVSRVTHGKIALKKERVALAPVVESAIEAAAPLIDARGHRLSVSIPPEPVHLDADPVRLAQAVGNLLNNAAKYTPPGGEIHVGVQLADANARAGEWENGGAMDAGASAARPSPTLPLSHSPTLRTAEIRVRDNGVGIAPDLLPHVFDVFVQGERGLDRAEGGLGIGLTLVRSLVEMHGGSLEAHSEGLGKGSEFIIRLPVAEVRSVERGVRRDAPARRRILVVDDNVDSAQMLAMLLEANGHDVRAAYSGPQALAFFEDGEGQPSPSWTPDVLLLDLGMPVMDGYEVARRLRREPALAGLTLVAVTGYGQDEDHEQSRAAGFDHHLVKPVAIAVLLQVLEGDPAGA